MTTLFSVSQLPQHFADKLLACEIQLELNEVIPKNTVIQILQLYSKGMEYFESIKSYRYMYFQRKITSLLNSPKVLTSISHQQQPKNQATDAEKEKEITIRHKHDSLFNKLTAETNSLTGEKIKTIIAENDFKLKEINDTIKDELSEQEKRLQLKIERRKFQKMTKKTLSATDFTNSKSTTDSLFNQGEKSRPKQKLEADFSAIIKQDEDEEGQHQSQHHGSHQGNYKSDLQGE